MLLQVPNFSMCRVRRFLPEPARESGNTSLPAAERRNLRDGLNRQTDVHSGSILLNHHIRRVREKSHYQVSAGCINPAETSNIFQNRYIHQPLSTVTGYNPIC